MITNGTEVIANHPQVEPFMGVVVKPKERSIRENVYVVMDLEDGEEYWLEEEHLVVVR